jgi:xanthine/uracil permease
VLRWSAGAGLGVAARDAVEAGPWIGFILANTVAAPIVVGHLFLLSETATAGLVQRTVVIACLISALQALRGHRLTAVEGPAGLWLSVMAALAQVDLGAHQRLLATLAEFRLALVCTGVVLAALSVFGAVSYLQRLFTGRVMAIYLILLSVQLASVFVPQAVVVNGRLDGITLAQSGLVILVTVLVAIRGPARLRSLSLLAGLLVGWLLAAALGAPRLGHVPPSLSAGIDLPGWGLSFNLGVAVTCIFAGLVNTSNTVATVRAVSQAAAGTGPVVEATPRLFDRTNLVTAVGNTLAGLTGSLGLISLSSSAGVVHLIRSSRRAPFVAACLVTAAAAAAPPTAAVLASIPVSVAAASLLVTTVPLMAMGLQNLRSPAGSDLQQVRVAVPLLLGLAILALPAKIFLDTPSILRLLLGNGLVVGVIVAVGLDRIPAARRPHGI